MTLANDQYPSSSAFDAIQAAINSSDGARADAIKQANAIFVVQLRNKTGAIESWCIDLKDKGEVRCGDEPKATVTLTLSDEDFAALVAGKANAQRLFIGGKLKITGDVMKSTKLEPILSQANQQRDSTKAKL